MSWPHLVKIVEKLRSPDGCPWDRKQTSESLKRYLLEEAYELFEAIDQKDPEAVKDELGDVLLQVLLHAQIAKENKAFTIDDVIANLSEKLIRRHPHVFADEHAQTPAEVVKKWDAVKETEKTAAARDSALDGVPKVFPALMRAEKIQKKAAKVGFDWDQTSEVVAKTREELSELEEAYRQGNKGQMEEELGDLLFAAVNLARFLDLDPEFALQEATAKFYHRFRIMENEIRKRGLRMKEMALGELDEYWAWAKSQLRKNPQP